jgi:hypothetical protein
MIDAGSGTAVAVIVLMRPSLLLLMMAIAGCTTSNPGACSCAAVNDPVCATDGVTYASGCDAECAGQKIAHAGFCAVDGGSCSCPNQGSPVCGSNGTTYPSGCAANCAGVAVVHNGACEGADLSVGDGSTHDGGSTGGACSSDSDCVWRDSGCCGICSNKTDSVPPPLGCGIACFAPPPCLCQMGHCAAGNLPQNASCDPNRDQCGPGLKCCATCCGVPPQGDMSWNPDPRCIQPMSTPQGAMCPPLA